MTDLIIGVIFVSCLVGVGIILTRHSNKTRREMLAKMEDTDIEEEVQKPAPEPKKETQPKPKPQPKVESKPEPKVEPKAEPKPVAASQPQSEKPRPASKPRRGRSKKKNG